MWRTCFALGILSWFIVAPSRSVGDDFERLSGDVLGTLWRSSQLKSHPGLSFRELESLPSVLRDARSALVLVKTDQGNLARLLVSPGFRNLTAGNAESKRADKKALVPILLVERYEVFEPGKAGNRLVEREGSYPLLRLTLRP